MHPSSQYHKELAHIVRADKDNKRCCDCGKNNPRWASTNLGCFMCLECSGIHRAIGVHITKIKSITLSDACFLVAITYYLLTLNSKSSS